MNELLLKLTGGDQRSIGRVDEVVAEVLNDPSLFGALFDGMRSNDPLIRMRAADAAEKLTATHSEWLELYKEELLRRISRVDQQEVRWHVAQMLPRLEWSEEERAQVVEILLGYLEDKSAIVKTLAMQALAELAERDENLRSKVLQLLEELTRTGSPAMVSRGRKLLRRLRR